ncbi:hypothetical protein [Novosphingobium sp.]|uniref:hypothetical protein n=1 Tax=Novosphingobium sp. TaxID=1874826 RepID=UPI0025EAF911|nr:hypothetical protein [Novosphingobium sp.]
MKIKLINIVALAALASSVPAIAQKTVNGVTMQRGFMGQKVTPEEMAVIGKGAFKGAHRVAITVFNVAFPDENHLVAKTSGHAGGFVSSARSDLRTTMTGVDRATRQRIADQAYKTFVAQLTAAGYEVVEAPELARLAPEYATWTPQPNFSQGRFGTYVAPTGRSLFWWPGDTMKRNATGAFDYSMSALQMMTDRPQAFGRTPMVGYIAQVGTIAVTLVVDYGVYSTSGVSGKGFGGKASAGFLPGVTVAAGVGIDRATTLNYWKPNSGGFGALAVLQIPVRSEAAFITDRGVEGAVDAAIVADPIKFEAAASDVINQALPKFVSVMLENH